MSFPPPVRSRRVYAGSSAGFGGDDAEAPEDTGASSLKPAVVKASVMRTRTIPGRVILLFEAFAASNASGFAKGAAARQLLKFISRSLLPNTPTRAPTPTPFSPLSTSTPSTPSSAAS